jgi:hypothetical protein
VLCDPRLRQMRYGRRLLAALPPMGVLADEPKRWTGWRAGRQR